MKNLFTRLLLIVGLHAVFAFAIVSSGHAQTPPADPVALAPAAPDDGSQVFAAIVSALSVVLPAKFAGWFVALGSIVGVLRLVFKPIVTAIEAFVKSTPSTADDEFVAKAQHSPAYKAFTWFLDLFGSIKVGPQFTAKPSAPPEVAKS